MAVHTDTHQETRRRHDEFEREPIGTSGPAKTSTNPTSRVEISDTLLRLLEQSAQSLRHASENIENRGMKLMLKVIAQERVVMYNALREAAGYGLADPLDPDHKGSGATLQEGLEDIQTSMTVQRQGRETVTLSHLREDEQELLQAYDVSLQGNQASQLGNLLSSQREHVAQFYSRLQTVGEGLEPIVARIFDTRAEGENAVARLRESGLDPTQIDVAPITQVSRPVARTAVATASPKSAIIAGAFSGAAIGGVIGLAFALFVWLAPQLIGWVIVGPWAMLLGAIIIGAVFGVVFGFFIGQNKREDDVAVTMDGLVNGEMLVVAYPLPQQAPMVEDVLQVHHARELNR